MALEAITLSGRHVELVPLAHEHHDGLVKAVQDGNLWQLWYTGVPAPEAMSAHIDRCLGLQATGVMLPFAVFDRASESVVGMTTYMNIDPAGPRVEIGSTWYAKRAQQTPLNTEAKLLLLSHAFDSLDCLAVEFRTHFLNHQSRGAIERLGAKLDGILRQHMRMRDGTLRDTCVYSIIPSEWPAVRSNLEWQLEKPR
ncbi:GNAT family N-acetyltransferase [Rhizobium leguminosarum]|uniref:Acetyltransferase (GNAT) domain family protein n=1 Tax=Rhizobium leguminosarum TaxID=384 RepID=A0A2Z4YHG4_RHILE|nr:GNAT family protein [Rhizobium leguminosarum]AXA40887.1 Acetyltransferase (GNAT) domain family protein [Rhizobium leguminosarum]